MNKMQEFFNSKAKNWDKRSNIKSYDFYRNFVLENFHLKKGMRVLDLGCGTGIITNQIYEVTKTEVIGMDISDEMIKIANKKNQNKAIKYVAEDFYLTSLSGFDTIIVHNAYPHFIDKQGFKDKCLSILNEAGYLIICYSNAKNVINERHKNTDKDLYNEILPANEEAKFYQDKFKIVSLKDDKEYLIVLEKR